MAEQDLDRRHAATPYKLQRARERGQAARSADLVGAVVFAAAMAYLAGRGLDAVLAQFRFDAALLAQVAAATRGDLSMAAPGHLISHMLRAMAALLAPLFATLVAGAVVANLLQTGPMLSFEPVKMDLDRVNPVSGFRRLFSGRLLFDLVRTVLKLAVLAGMAFALLRAELPGLQRLGGLSALQTLHALLDDIVRLGLALALALAFIGLLDLLYTRHAFARKMRMSQRELKEEARHREGDPRIRARLRELRQETRKRSLALRQTRNADVLITNPTHLAVALKYEHGQMASPQLLAKGAGQLAAAMRELAARHRIPVVQNPPLARELFRALPVGQSVPAEFFEQVARIFVWVFAMREQQRLRNRAPGVHA